MTLAGSGRVVLSGSNTYTGGTIVECRHPGRCQRKQGSATGSGIVTLNGGILASDPIAGGSIAGEVLPAPGPRPSPPAASVPSAA